MYMHWLHITIFVVIYNTFYIHICRLKFDVQAFEQPLSFEN